MKYISVVLFFLVFFACSNRQLLQGEILVVPKMEEGESQKMRIREEVFLQGQGSVPQPGREQLIGAVEYEFTTRLLEKKKNKWLFSLTAEYLHFKTDHLPSQLRHACKKALLPHLTFLYTTNENGQFKEITNWKALEEFDDQLFERVFIELSKETKSSQQAYVKKYMEEFLSTEALQNEFVEKIKTIHSYYGIPLSANESFSREQELSIVQLKNSYRVKSNIQLLDIKQRSDRLSGQENYLIPSHVLKEIQQDFLIQAQSNIPLGYSSDFSKDDYYGPIGVQQNISFEISQSEGRILKIDKNNTVNRRVADKVIIQRIATAYRLKE